MTDSDMAKQILIFPGDGIGPEIMAEAVKAGRIDTVRPEHTPEAMNRPPRVDDHGGEVYVYRRAGQKCYICGTPISEQVMEGRNLFWCPTCQKGD